MKLVTFADKSLMIGDEAADLLIEYAAALANVGRADSVEVRTIGSDHEEIVATFLLDSGASLMAETANTTDAEPDNSEVMEYMRTQMEFLRKPPAVVADDITKTSDFTDFDR